MLALGADRAVLLETDGREWGPIATAAAIAAAARRAGPYDLLLFGNEAADTGDYQVGGPGRARARPAVRDRHQEAGGQRHRRAGAARVPRAWRRSTTCRCPRWSPSRRASTCPGTRRCPGGCGPSAPRSSSPHPQWHAEGLRKERLRVPGGRDQAGRDPRHRRRRRARPGRPARRARGAVMTVLCLVERDGDGAADVSLRALTFARSLAGSGAGGVAAAVFGPGGARRAVRPAAWRTRTRSRPG